MTTYTITGSQEITRYVVTADLADAPLVEKSYTSSIRFRPERVTVVFEHTSATGWQIAPLSIRGPRILKDGTRREEVIEDFLPSNIPAWVEPIVQAAFPTVEPVHTEATLGTTGEVDPPVAQEVEQAEITGFDPAVGERVCVLNSRNVGGETYVDEAPSWTTVERITKTLIITADGRRWARGGDRDGRGLRVKNETALLFSSRRLVPADHPGIQEKTQIWQDQGCRARS